MVIGFRMTLNKTAYVVARMMLTDILADQMTQIYDEPGSKFDQHVKKRRKRGLTVEQSAAMVERKRSMDP